MSRSNPPTGTLETPLGPLAPTGRQLRIAGMDIFVVADGRGAGVRAVADHLGLLIQAQAVELI